MNLPMSWLNDYMDIDVTPKEYSDRLTMTGSKVEGWENMGESVQNVVAGKVLTCEDHPDSDHLHVCTVDAGTGEILQIVCGAPNVKAGIIVPVALVGAVLPDGKIKKGKLRGVESYGMLCSREGLFKAVSAVTETEGRAGKRKDMNSDLADRLADRAEGGF